MARINNVMPKRPDLRRLATVTSVDLRDLGRNTGEIDRFLTGMNASAAAIGERHDELTKIFGAEAATYWRRDADSFLVHIAYLLPSIGSIFEGGIWLVPMLLSRPRPTASVGSWTMDRDWRSRPRTSSVMCRFRSHPTHRSM